MPATLATHNPVQPYQTPNQLSQFDFAFSLSQQIINSQLRDARNGWVDDIPGFDRVHATADVAGDSITLDAALGELIVDLNASTPDAMRLSMPVSTGALRSPALGTVQLDNMLLRFTAPLRRREIGMDVLRGAAPELADKAQAVIDELGLKSNLFSIEALYMDLTSLDRMEAVSVQQDKAVLAPPAAVVEALRACLRSLAATQPVLLQAVVLPDRSEHPSTFVMRDFTYNITPCAGNPNAATLDYLGVFWRGLDMPANLVEARKQPGAWIDPQLAPTVTMRAGVLALRGEQVAQELAATLQRVFDAAYARMDAANQRRRDQGAVRNPGLELPHPEAELLKRITVEARGKQIALQSDARCNSYQWSDENVAYTLKKSLRLSLVPTPGLGYRLDGAMVVDLLRERKVNLDIVSAASAVITADIFGELRLNSPANEFDCDVTTALTMGFRPATEVKSDNGNFWKWILQVNTAYDQRLASGFAADARAAIEKMLNEALHDLNVDLGTLAIVPPGGGVFTFATPRFSPQRDLLLDIGYRGVLPQGEQP
ncbi:MAG: hypothetical protein ABW069_18270 [Duganella sp.]